MPAFNFLQSQKIDIQLIDSRCKSLYAVGDTQLYPERSSGAPELHRFLMACDHTTIRRSRFPHADRRHYTANLAMPKILLERVFLAYRATRLLKEIISVFLSNLRLA